MRMRACTVTSLLTLLASMLVPSDADAQGAATPPPAGPQTPAATQPTPVFTPQPVTMAELLAETAPIEKPPRQRVRLGRLALIIRRRRLTPAR